MFLQEAKDQYQRALKRGQKYQRACLLRGENPYPVVLDEFLDEEMVNGTTDLGVLDIPSAPLGTAKVPAWTAPL